ncbi:MAG: hypothetical protein WEG56_09435 [Chloroflexota bacterium]
MPDSRDQLLATTDDIAADASELEAIEVAKANLDVADPRQDELATRAVDIARDLVPKTLAQLEIVDEE